MSNSTDNIKGDNLDRLAALHAQEIVRYAPKADDAKALDNLATKALGVLQENGIYAAVLFLASRREGKDKYHAPKVMEKILDLLDEINKKFNFKWPGKPDPQVSEEVLRYISNHVVVNLERLLLAKETLEQMLIYARYGAKARAAEGDGR